MIFYVDIMLGTPVVEVLRTDFEFLHIGRHEDLDGVVQVIFVMAGDAAHAEPAHLTGKVACDWP